MLSIGLTLESAPGLRAQAGLVGPNAVIQLAQALRAQPGGEDDARLVFESAGLARLLRSRPDAMIDETIPARLFDSLWMEFPGEYARRVAYDAGQRTGAYVLANRIPAIAHLALRALPASLGTPLLLDAIRRNAWTFAGSGTCLVANGSPALVTIVANPLTMPGCVWHVGVFERLFRTLIRRTTQVRHSQIRIDGVPASRFEIDIDGTVPKDQTP